VQGADFKSLYYCKERKNQKKKKKKPQKLQWPTNSQDMMKTELEVKST
jgi:ribosomal protein L24E